jgi:predicted regulator of Ras-like GTPase activity (Roadblock/LC7/MglB family)
LAPPPPPAPAAARPAGAERGLQTLELVEEEVAAAPAAAPAALGRAQAMPAGVAPVAATEPAGDPTRLFDPLLAGGQILGALLLDGRGLVLAGRLAGDAAARAEEVGAVMGGTADEVARAVAHLELSAWRGMLLECGGALLHVAPAGDDALLVLAAKRDAPRGWLLRTAQRAVALAGPYLRSNA